MLDGVLSFRAHLATVKQALIFLAKLRGQTRHFGFSFWFAATFETLKAAKQRPLVLNLDTDCNYRRDTISQGIEILVWQSSIAARDRCQ